MTQCTQSILMRVRMMSATWGASAATPTSGCMLMMYCRRLHTLNRKAEHAFKDECKATTHQGVWRDDVGHLGRQRRYTHQGVHVDYVLQATAHMKRKAKHTV